MRVVYVSHTGMTEPLGQSQVLPYLRGLARRGIQFGLVSFEPSDQTAAELGALVEQLGEAGIDYRPQRRTPGHRVSAKLRDLTQGIKVAFELGRGAALYHARSHLAASIAWAAARLRGARFLFDVRGLLAEEYVDGGHWKAGAPIVRLTQRAETVLLHRADGVVTLTEVLRDELLGRGLRAPVEVVPCCVDLVRFVRNEDRGRAIRQELGLGDAPVVIYSGSLGSWYRFDRASHLAALLTKRLPSLHLVVLSQSPERDVIAQLAPTFPRERLRVARVAPQEMPDYLSVACAGISFIEPCPSKRASSPTKVAEYLACGLLTIQNGGVGDSARFMKEPAIVTVPALTDEALASAVDEIAARLATRTLATEARDAAERHFSLEGVGIARYLRHYERICAEAA